MGLDRPELRSPFGALWLAKFCLVWFWVVCAASQRVPLTGPMVLFFCFFFVFVFVFCLSWCVVCPPPPSLPQKGPKVRTAAMQGFINTFKSRDVIGDAEAGVTSTPASTASYGSRSTMSSHGSHASMRSGRSSRPTGHLRALAALNASSSSSDAAAARVCRVCVV